jgi:hypothetical protein
MFPLFSTLIITESAMNINVLQSIVFFHLTSSFNDPSVNSFSVQCSDPLLKKDTSRGILLYS